MLRRANVTKAAALLLATAAAAMGSACRPALAGTDTDQLSVTATVLSSCSLNGGALNFGQYVAGQQADLDGEGAINYVNCTGELTFSLDGGGSGSVSARQMRSGASRLNYQIYRNPTRTAVWGTGGEAHGAIVIGTARSGAVPFYGRIFRNQTVPDGVYSDFVNITLTF